ncbi:unnamed protein product, partial [Oncorhynchus mykiss]
FLLTVLVIILTPRGEILRGAPDRGRLSVVLYVFHFLIIAPTVDFFKPSCLPIADSVFPAWCLSTILFLVSFDSSLVLAIVEFGVWVSTACLLCEGYTVVGYALYFYTYSTWKGRSVYMEDLYVMPDFRGKGIGTGLMAKVAQVGVEKQCVRLQLSVLDWNKPSLDFYIAKGAEDLTAKEGWHFLRFHGQTLDTLAKEAPKD